MTASISPLKPRPLCELHAHIGGCFAADDLLAIIGEREIDWSLYERHYRAAHGREPDIRRVLAAVRSGQPGARQTFAEQYVFGERDAGNFDRFLASFALLGCATALNDPRLQHQFTAEARAECAFIVQRIAAAWRAQGIGHGELRVMIGNDLPPVVRRQLYRVLLEDLIANSDASLTLRLAPSLPREDPWPAWNVVRELALSEVGHALTAVDVCHIEEDHAPRTFAKLAEHLRSFNQAHPERALALLYHVGESYRDKSLESAIRWCDEAATLLGAHRLGHAIALGIDPAHHGRHTRSETVAERRDQLAYDLAHLDALRQQGVAIDPDALRGEQDALRPLAAEARIEQVYDARRLDQLIGRQRVAIERIRRAGAVVEVCPTSNRRIAGLTRVDHHALHRFHAEGLPMVVASDDPGLMGIILAEEVAWVAGQTGESVDQLTEQAWRCRSELMAGRQVPDLTCAPATDHTAGSPAIAP